jgi:hypothetical protein
VGEIAAAERALEEAGRFARNVHERQQIRQRLARLKANGSEKDTP